MSEEEAKLRAKELNRKGREGKSFIYASEYANSISCGLSEEYARVRAEIFLRLYNEKSRTCLLSYEYDRDNKVFLSIREQTRLQAGFDLERKRVENEIAGYEKTVGRGKNLIYAMEYARLMEAKVAIEEADLRAKIYESEIRDGRSPTYAREYAKYLFERKKKVLRARRHASNVEQEAMLKESNFEKECAELEGEYNNQLNINSRIYLFNGKVEKGYLYAMEYARIFAKYGKPVIAKKCANIFKDNSYAREYARAIVILNLSKEQAERQATICENEVRRGQDYMHASEYARLLVSGEKDQGSIREKAEIFNQLMKLGAIEDFASAFAGLIVELNIEPSEVRTNKTKE